MKKLICIIGTDGSGKTTLISAVVEELSVRGFSVGGVWFGAIGYLMVPVRKVLKRFWKQKTHHNSKLGVTKTPSKNTSGYGSEIKRKNAAAKKYAWAIPIYVNIAWLDYRIQVAKKFFNTRNCEIVVADRYIFDVAINIGLTVGWTPDEVVRFAQAKLRYLPLPQLRVFLRVTPEVSLSRKDDIPDIDYLRLRLSYYEAIADAFDFIHRDGTLPIEENRDWLLDQAYTDLKIVHPPMGSGS